jgi:hypothetical protein
VKGTKPQQNAESAGTGQALIEKIDWEKAMIVRESIKAYGCPDIASIHLLSLLATYSYNETHLHKGLWLNPRGCRSTVSLPASFRAVYPCNDSPSFSLRTCRWASDSSGWPMRGTGRRHAPVYRQGTQTVLKARLAKRSLRQQTGTGDVNWNQTLEIEQETPMFIREQG